MKEDLLINLDYKKQTKIWRNLSIILVCLFLIFILKNIKKNKSTKEDYIFSDIIAEIEIDDEIIEDDYRDKKISELISDNRVKAVILNIDSPGGMVTPSEILYDLISKLNEKKPVVVLMGGMATSGAYMVAIASDYLIARNTTLTGSIGVLMQSYEIVDLAKKLGIELKTFKSSELKGMPSLFEKNNEHSNIVLQDTVDDIYQYFADLVKTRRKMTDENFKLAINGQAFTGRQALKIGLIDEIGDKNSALNYLKTKGINTELPIVNISLKQKRRMSIFNRLASLIFFKIGENDDFAFKNHNGALSIYNNYI